MSRTVLVVAKEDLFKGMPYFHGFAAAHAMKFDLNHCRNMMRFWPKDAAETDAKLKQIIPYIVIYRNSDGAILSYVRGKAGEEGRLHDLLSIGFGGHIEPQDGPEGWHANAAINACIKRELLEELGIRLSDFIFPQLVGYLNDDSNPVGEVHFGLVYLARVNEEQANLIDSNEDAIKTLRWYQLPLLRADRGLENWSQSVVHAFSSHPEVMNALGHNL